MELFEAILTRYSARAYLDQPVPHETLVEVLQAAGRAPSWSNTQAWITHAVTGEPLAALRKKLVTASLNQPPNPDRPWPQGYTSPYKDRRAQNGYAMYQHVGVPKDDAAARTQSFARNFALFEAPVGLFFFLRNDLNHCYELDLGCYMQTLMLAATAKGLATCAQAALGCYPDIVRDTLGVEDNYDLICGMALGYADESDPYATYRSERVPLIESVTFHGNNETATG